MFTCSERNCWSATANDHESEGYLLWTTFSLYGPMLTATTVDKRTFWPVMVTRVPPDKGPCNGRTLSTVTGLCDPANSTEISIMKWNYKFVSLSAIAHHAPPFLSFLLLYVVENSNLRIAFEYLEIIYIARNQSHLPTFLPLGLCLCYFSRNYFRKSSALSQEVLCENEFWHEIATQGHLFCNQLQANKG